MSNKIGWAVGGMIAGVILDMTGYAKDMVQNANVQVGLKSMMSVIPVGAGIIALLILVFFYKLDEPLMKKVKEELEERRKKSGDGVITA
jgi:GPH family glycoside/pentoside/hexuronide:cation symporter